MQTLPTAPRKKPTCGHRPAIWENMLGTVYAMNDDGEAKYFDYDYAAARAHCQVDEEGRDPRWFKNSTPWWYSGMGPRKGKMVLWVKDGNNS